MAGHVVSDLASALMAENADAAAEIAIELRKHGVFVSFGDAPLSLAANDLKTSTVDDIIRELDRRHAGLLVCTLTVGFDNKELWRHRVSGSKRLVSAMAGSLSEAINKKFKGRDDEQLETA